MPLCSRHCSVSSCSWLIERRAIIGTSRPRAFALRNTCNIQRRKDTLATPLLLPQIWMSTSTLTWALSSNELVCEHVRAHGVSAFELICRHVSESLSGAAVSSRSFASTSTLLDSSSSANLDLSSSTSCSATASNSRPASSSATIFDCSSATSFSLESSARSRPAWEQARSPFNFSSSSRSTRSFLRQFSSASVVASCEAASLLFSSTISSRNSCCTSSHSDCNCALLCSDAASFSWISSISSANSWSCASVKLPCCNRRASAASLAHFVCSSRRTWRSCIWVSSRLRASPASESCADTPRAASCSD